MALRHERVTITGAYNINPLTGMAEIRWIPYYSTPNVPPAAYKFDLFQALANWTTGGTGTASIVGAPGPADPWHQDESVLDLFAWGYRDVDVTAANYFNVGVAGAYKEIEFSLDLRQIDDAASLEVSYSTNTNRFYMKIYDGGNKMDIWSDSLGGWKRVLDFGAWPKPPDITHQICKFRFVMCETDKTVTGYVTTYNTVTQDWDFFVPMLFKNATDLNPECDYTPTVNGEFKLKLHNVVASSHVFVDHVKVYNSGATPLTPYDAALGEPTFAKYELHRSTVKDFTPTWGPGGTWVADVNVYNTTSQILSGFTLGRVSYVKVLVIDTATPGTTPFKWWSNELEVIVPKPIFNFLWGYIRGFKKMASWLWTRTAQGKQSPAFLWVRTVLGDKQASWLWALAKGVRKPPAWLWSKVIKGGKQNSWLWSKVVNVGKQYSWLWGKVVGVRYVWLWARASKGEKQYGWLFAEACRGARRYSFLWCQTRESIPFIINKRKHAEALIANCQWQQQLHGDKNS